ncbi:MAG TPA: hypothetical protein VKD47_07545 [Miltoncostaeaceae bacterium]|nr:hypothetical protein [Miltoncostaeaceae bacterium]
MDIGRETRKYTIEPATTPARRIETPAVAPEPVPAQALVLARGDRA